MKYRYLLFPPAILCGLFGLYAVAFAIPNALALRRALMPDLVRGIAIAITLMAGLALLLPHRLIPWLLARARISGAFPLRAMAVLILLATLGTASLSGVVADWALLVSVGVFTLLFIFPGVIYWAGAARQPKGAPVAEAESSQALNSQVLSSAELGRIFGEAVRQYPLALRLLVVLPTVLPLLASFAFFNNWHVIPSGWLADNAVPLGCALGLAAIALNAAILFRSLSPMQWAANRFTLMVMAVVAFGVLTSAYVSLLRTVIPTLAADYAGLAQERVATVVGVERGSRKGCRDTADITTDLIVLNLCVPDHPWIGELRPDDRLLLRGKATSLGFALESYARIP
ncbi:hypothetical protein HOY34_01145 [Xinfangfangia sp. D13-10-4-6]|uniref:hypothetical protein n=1 Tax=Pseudogemmobacter hezensis TaxID=2737662 RepID=UPI0015532FB7|nr:hypothetical protein [Pseudogemmobacter hezensis]NPD13804.1 hypothetical protein [Pseudogemmobacter hezensis]